MLTRPDGLRLIADRYPSDPIVVTLGGTLREMVAIAGRRPNFLPILDAMGQPLPIALGLAMGLDDRSDVDRVIVVEGDGSLLMGFSAMTTAGHVKPQKLMTIIFDNGVYLATGGQPTAASDVDYCAVAMACGWAGARDVRGDLDDLEAALAWADDVDGPVFLRVHVGTETIPTELLLEDPVVLGHEFAQWLHGNQSTR